MENKSKETLLFVDDETCILDIAHTYFNARGYHVITAKNGREATEMLWSHRVDCCFTDINMPEMDGLEFAEYMRQYDNTVPVVIMTGYPSLDSTIHTLKNGVVDYLIKPINLQQMELCVQRVLRERRLLIQNLMLSKEVEGKVKIEQLNKELTAKVEELNIFNRILGDFASFHESMDIFRQLVDMALEIVNADASCFYLVGDGEAKLTRIAEAQRSNSTNGDLSESVETGNTAPPAVETDGLIRSLIADVITDDRPLLIAKNGNGHSRLPGHVHSFMMAPLKIRSRIFGVLSAGIHHEGARFGEKELYYLSFMTNKAASAIENLALYENIYHNLLATLYAFVKAIEARDPYTKEHSNRVTRLAIALSQAMSCSAEDQEILKVAGLLHDIGKIGIRDDILLKPDRLTPEEFRIIQQHPVIGADIMSHLGLWNREMMIVRGHHERFDGTGYPDRLTGEKIPLLARILSVADVYDAVASDRAYRKRMEESKILDIMYNGAGTQFDPDIIAVFRMLYESGEVAELSREAKVLDSSANTAPPSAG
jgi:putative nucleotidyltransferase with HDIG domain